MNIQKYQYKTELHAHTSPASGCSRVSASEAVELYAGLGYHSIVICNHFYPGMRFVKNRKQCIEAYLADYDLAVKAGKKCGINVILGCEMRFTENINDYLLFGIDRSSFDFLYDNLDTGIESFSGKFRSDGQMIIQAHPFRNGMTDVPPEYLDGIEAFNMHPNHNSRNGLAAKHARQHDLIITAGSDFHEFGHEGGAALLTETEMKSSADIVKVLKSGSYLLETGGHVLIP